MKGVVVDALGAVGVGGAVEVDVEALILVGDPYTMLAKLRRRCSCYTFVQLPWRNLQSSRSSSMTTAFVQYRVIWNVRLTDAEYLRDVGGAVAVAVACSN